MATAGSERDGTPPAVVRRRIGLVVTVGLTAALGAMVVAGVAPRSATGVTVVYLGTLVAAVVAAILAGWSSTGRWRTPALGALLVWRIVLYWNLVSSRRDDPMNPYYLLGPDPWVIPVAEGVLIIVILGRVVPRGHGIGSIRFGLAGMATWLVVAAVVGAAYLVAPRAEERSDADLPDDVEVWDYSFTGTSGQFCEAYRLEPVAPFLVVRRLDSDIDCWAQ